ncbi:MAG: glutamine-hydrolyzing GMP synthase [Proteobacteria bacterium]|jgi:GMP synthase (glutamine-hydrolysing)|nr:glutamine-hydrolyzing GMP synthase [Pseudomonadota bacterium]
MHSDPHKDRILILDFGSQYSQLIARRVRELGVYCELWAYDRTVEEIAGFAPSGIILSGGPSSVTKNTTPRAPEGLFEMGLPVLGICYGMQCMAGMLGGEVETSDEREYGYAKVEVISDGGGQSILETGEMDVWMSHGDRVNRLPDGFQVVGRSQNAPLAAIADPQRQFYGLQFHPEVTHTQDGDKVLGRFVHDVCGCTADWNAGNIIEASIAQVREQAGDDNVILGLSGGVDSSVVAAMLHKAIGKQLTCIFVDNGLLRLHEGDQVMETFARHMGVKVIRVDAEERFLSALVGVEDPERKRKIIGGVFIEIFEEEARKIENVKWLAQGTIYPDVIESAASRTGKAEVIKSHHNVGGLPDDMELQLLEPLRELFKDEVRKIGVELGLSEKMVYRHPFPGPGLGVRILGEVKKEYADTLREADAIFMEELYANDWYQKTSQAFAVFLPVKSVGVVGDQRAYEWVISLRAVETIDFMTATWAHIPYDVLSHISNRIINEVRGVSRVVYDISSKPPATIEWE